LAFELEFLIIRIDVCTYALSNTQLTVFDVNMWRSCGILWWGTEIVTVGWLLMFTVLLRFIALYFAYSAREVRRTSAEHSHRAHPSQS